MCIRDSSRQVESHGRVKSCDECSNVRNTFTVIEIAQIVDSGFQTHYQRTASEPNTYEIMLLKDKEINYDWYREGEYPNELIAEQLNVPRELADDIHKILAEEHADYEAAIIGEETEYGDEVLYEEKAISDNGLYWEWKQFEKTVLNEVRYFSEGAKGFLDSVFENLETLTTWEGKPIVQTLNPETKAKSFYRGRVFHQDKNIEAALERPDQHIGPAPSNLAMSGRMNPRNISVFYGATHPEIALSELRPPVGASVIMGEFQVIRPLKLLNLKRLQKIFTTGSIFDPQYAIELSKAHFLKSLVTMMTRPTNPNNSDAEYLPTQLIADYLANANDTKLDGILYPSSQTTKKGMNVVLFRRASKVENIDIPDNTKMSTRMWEEYEDGSERSYSVIEWVPKQEDETEKWDEKNDPFQLFLHYNFNIDKDTRENTLRINKESVHVHIIESTKIKTDKHRVRRNRYEKTDAGSVLL